MSGAIKQNSNPSRKKTDFQTSPLYPYLGGQSIFTKRKESKGTIVSIQCCVTNNLMFKGLKP